MYRILIVEDDSAIAHSMKRQIEAWGNQAEIVTDFTDILPQFTAYDPHLVLLDIMLPFFNGYHWCSEIRKISTVPVVFLSSASDNMNILMAMNLGADDFLPKPVDLNVLVAKLNAVLRRVYDRSDKVPALECHGAVLNLNDGTLTYADEQLELTRNEFRILQTLMENRGKIVSRDKLMTRLWQNDC